MRELIILNYTMDKAHPVLSHQSDVAYLLSSHFDHTTVITADSPSPYVLANLEVISTNWSKGGRLSKTIRLVVISLPIMWKYRKSAVVFSHMTDFQSALLGPFIKILGLRHFLWYAHKTKSKYLKIANIFVDGIITSTVGSCPIQSSKVHAIGQAIDETFFRFHRGNSNSALFNALHVGRFDQSKRIGEIISSVSDLRNTFPQLMFTQVGSPSTPSSEKVAINLTNEWQTAISAGWLKFLPTMNRSDLPAMIPKFDVFFHAYSGSLDKTLIEATLCGLPVITLNPEYLTEFGSWSGQLNISMEVEYLSLVKMDENKYREELQRRYRICVDRHTRAKWIKSLVEILVEEKQTSGGRES